MGHRKALSGFVFAVAMSPLLACATLPRTTEDGGKAWLRAETQHIVLETDLGTHEAHDLALELENWRSAMTAALFAGARPPQQPLHVVVLAGRELETLNPAIGGLFTESLYMGPVLLVGAQEASERTRIMKHELTHAILAENLGRLPQWLNEGLAVYLQGTQLDETTGRVSWGDLTTERASACAAPATTVARALDPQPWAAAEVGDLERAAGEVVHMLARRHSTELGCLLAGLSRFGDVESTLDRCFAGAAGWRSETLRAGADEGNAVGAAHIDLYSGEPRIAPMPDAYVHALLAFVDVTVGATLSPDTGARADRVASFEHHVQRALELDPNQILAASLELATTAPDGDPTGELTARLVQAHPDDWRAWHWRAVVFSTGAADVRHALAKAAELAPDRLDVIQLLLRDAVDARHWVEAASFGIRAFRLRPASEANRGLVLAALGSVERGADRETAQGATRDVGKSVRGFLAAETGAFGARRDDETLSNQVLSYAKAEAIEPKPSLSSLPSDAIYF